MRKCEIASFAMLRSRFLVIAPNSKFRNPAIPQFRNSFYGCTWMLPPPCFTSTNEYDDNGKLVHPTILL